MNNNDDTSKDSGTNEGNETRIYLAPGSTLQSPAEDAHDKHIDLQRDSNIAVSNDDLHDTNADRYAGSDRAGTAERNDNQPRTEEG